MGRLGSRAPRGFGERDAELRVASFDIKGRDWNGHGEELLWPGSSPDSGAGVDFEVVPGHPERPRTRKAAELRNANVTGDQENRGGPCACAGGEVHHCHDDLEVGLAAVGSFGLEGGGRKCPPTLPHWRRRMAESRFCCGRRGSLIAENSAQGKAEASLQGVDARWFLRPRRG